VKKNSHWIKNAIFGGPNNTSKLENIFKTGLKTTSLISAINVDLAVCDKNYILIISFVIQKKNKFHYFVSHF